MGCSHLPRPRLRQISKPRYGLIQSNAYGGIVLKRRRRRLEWIHRFPGSVFTLGSDKDQREFSLSRSLQVSCVNARGIPTVVYQVHHMLSYPGGGVGTLARGVGTLGYPPSGPG